MRPLILIALIATIVTSCSTSQNVGGGMLQKRKYTKGFYWNHGGNGRSVDQAVAKEEIKQEEAVIAAAPEAVKQESVVKNTPAQTAENVVVPGVSENKDVTAAAHTAVVPAVKNEREAPFRKPASKTDEQKQTVLKKNKSVNDVMRKKQKSGAGDADGMFVLAVIFAILIPPIGVLIYTNIDWMKVLICLLLTILFFLPGMIYALLVVFDVI